MFGLQAEVVDELLGEQAHHGQVSVQSSSGQVHSRQYCSVLQLHYRHAAAALFGRRGGKSGDQRMLLQKSRRARASAGPCRSRESAGRPADRSAATRRETVPRARSLRRPCSRSRSDPPSCVSRGCSSTCTLTRAGAAGAARLPTTRRSRTLARIRLPRTSRSAVPSCTAVTIAFETEAADDHAVADRDAAAMRDGGSDRGAVERRRSRRSRIRFGDRVDGCARVAARRAGLAGRHQARRGLRRSPSAFAFSSAITSSISRRAWRTCVSSSSFRRLRNVSSRCRSASSRWRMRASAAASVSRSRGRQPLLVLERAHVAVDLREVLGELRLARAEVLARRGDDRRIEPEPAGDFQRQAAARRCRTRSW